MKKAQISITITWFVAFLIIFFIIASYLFFSSILGTSKSFSWNKNEMKYDGSTYLDLESQRELAVVLNSQVNNEKLKDLIIQWNNSGDSNIKIRIESNAKSILEYNKKPNECYFFAIDRDSSGMSSDSLIVGGESLYSGFESYINSAYLFSGNKKIKVELYTGTC